MVSMRRITDENKDEGEDDEDEDKSDKKVPYVQ